jgi:RimJ/RimL family protein N-acetyltransferase
MYQVSAELLKSMRLIEIDIHGKPNTSIELSEVAKSICESTVKLYEKQGFSPPWIGYLAEKDGQIVGTCAFKSAPVKNRVEIAYFTFPVFERQGIATEMILQLIKIAKSYNPDLTIFAQTLPEDNVSTYILTKTGFHHVRSFNHPEDGYIWEWELNLFIQNARQ